MPLPPLPVISRRFFSFSIPSHIPFMPVKTSIQRIVSVMQKHCLPLPLAGGLDSNAVRWGGKPSRWLGSERRLLFPPVSPRKQGESYAALHGMVCLYLTMLTQAAHAGAWTQKAGEVQLINQFSYYRSNEYRDLNGHTRPQPDYAKWEWNPYLEYGYDDATTLGASLYLQRASSSGQTNYGLAESEWFMRRRLWQQGGFVLSAVPKIKLPGLGNNDAPLIGSSHADAALGLEGGYGFSWLRRWHYAALQSEYRYRFGNPRDQYRASATLGVGVSDKLVLMPQAFFTWRASDTQTAPFTQSPRDDYDLTTLQFSALYRLTDSQQVQLGAFRDVSGKNAGQGGGVTLALWSHF